MIGALLLLAAAVTDAPTPMAERVARVAVLNKQTAKVQEFALKPGMRATYGRLSVTLRACETTPPWERPAQTGAFVQIDDAASRKRVFSGWLFAESPSLNPFDHPVYDVWVKSCAMSFPESGPDTIGSGRAKAAETAKPSSLPKSAATPSAEDSSPR